MLIEKHEKETDVYHWEKKSDWIQDSSLNSPIKFSEIGKIDDTNTRNRKR